MDDVRPRTLRERQREQTRQHLLNCAAELIGAQGFAATSIDDIARAAGAGRATVYSYFETKDALLAEIIQLMREEADEMYREFGDLPRWTRPAVAEWVDAVFERWRVDHPRNRAAAEVGTKRMVEQNAKYHRRYIDGLLGSHGAERFSADEARVRASLVISMIESFMQKYYAFDLDFDPLTTRTTVAETIADLLEIHP